MPLVTPPLFQPHTNYRTLDFDKPLSTRMVQKIVKKWADYSRLGDLSPHDLPRTAITRALESGLTYRQVQMSKHRDPKTVMRYDRGRASMEQTAVNFPVRVALTKPVTTVRPDGLGSSARIACAASAGAGLPVKQSSSVS
jgi:integrase